jgi:hypothetical protein
MLFIKKQEHSPKKVSHSGILKKQSPWVFTENVVDKTKRIGSHATQMPLKMTCSLHIN